MTDHLRRLQSLLDLFFPEIQKAFYSVNSKGCLQFLSKYPTIASLENADVDQEWLVNTTEKFCKDKAVYNAILKGISIIQGKDKKFSPESLPDILSEALSVGFDNHVGHDYIEDGESRFDFYRKKEEKIE